MTSDTPDRLLDRVRKLLSKAKAKGVTLPEAQALTAKAAAFSSWTTRGSGSRPT
jgi:Protein of unknown function (DUF2786)